MANAFNLTAQINLRGPSNIKPIIGQLRRELGTLKADVKLGIDKNAAKSVDSIRGRVDALNKSLIQSKGHVRELSASFRDLQSSLSSTKNINVGGGDRALASTASAAKAAAKNIKDSGNAIENFGKQSALAFKRFAAFSVVTSGIYAIINAVNNGVKAFIEFDRRLIQLQQVTGSGAVGISALEKEITKLALTLGVSSDGLAQVAITLAQAGLNAEETRVALAALAKTELAPSFDNITDTTEGAIAALRQFGLQASDLEAVLGSINAVAAAFAVESGDIITAIQRTGGVFASASRGVSEGKDALNEFIAVFTSIRATTRESAETIATGLRTIFTRIQRAETIEQLKEFGVNLQDLEGKFVGPFEAVRRLSAALNQLDPRDVRFASITEELGGFRQIGKVIPLIQQFATAQDALRVAQQGAGSLTEDQAIAQKSLANQIAKVREQFLALIRDVGKSTTFQVITKTILTLTSTLISLAGAFKPILPILGILGAVKGVSAITQFASGFFGAGGRGAGGTQDTGTEAVAQAERERADATTKASDVIRENTSALSSLTSAIQTLDSTIKSRPNTTPGSTLNSGGKVLGFARGGVVPGTGNRDTVPAVLTPGEFVIRKKAVETIGAANLQKMNKYAGGGIIKQDRIGYAIGEPDIAGQDTSVTVTQGEYDNFLNKTGLKSIPGGIIGSSQLGEFISDLEIPGINIADTSKRGKTYQVLAQGVPDNQQANINFNSIITTNLSNAIKNAARSITGSEPSADQIQSVMSDINEGMLGNLYESIIAASSPVGKTSLLELTTRAQRPFDFTEGLGSAYNEIYTKLRDIKYLDAKKTWAAFNRDTESNNFGIKNAIYGQLAQEAVDFFGESTGATSQADVIKNIRSYLLSKNVVGERTSETIAKILGVSISNTKPLISTLLAENLITPVPNKKNTYSVLSGQSSLSPETLNVGGKIIGNISSQLQRFAKGGSPQDTVPALLTPGEFVINKKAAQKIGYSKLKQINQADKLQGLNNGGIVGFANGGFVKNALAKSQKTITWGKGPNAPTTTSIDPRATELFQKQAAIDTIEQELSQLGINGLKFIGSGKDSLAYDAGDRIVKFSPGGLKKYSSNIPEQLKPSFAKLIEGYGVEVMPKVDTNVTDEDLANLQKIITSKGYEWGDAAKDNMGKLGNQLVVIDGDITPLRMPAPPLPKQMADGGPVKLYHGTMTGEGDVTLKSIKEKGILSSLAGGYGQGSGFYAWTSRDSALKHTQAIESGSIPTNAAKGGYRMIVELTEMLDPKNWDLDYEIQAGDVANFVFENFEKAQALLEKAKGIDLGGGLSDFTLRSKNAEFTNPYAGKKVRQIGLGFKENGTEKRTSVDTLGMDYTLRTGQVISGLVAALKAVDPTVMDAFEQEFFTNLKPGQALKYVGSAPLTPSNIEVFSTQPSDDKSWTNDPSADIRLKKGKDTRNYGQIGLTEDTGMISVGYYKNDERSGYLNAYKMRDYLYYVGDVRATGGYGPRLYDVAMEAATEKGAMLTSDRASVSDDAKGVWSTYFNSRPDVRKTPLKPDDWTKSSLIDPKLYGKEETWPPPTDPAWILQSGYSKTPELIRDSEAIKINKKALGGLIHRFANGGSPEDTVPALLTPGEFVINKKAAQKIGYSKLEKMNQADKLQGFNKGGIVGFVNGGPVTASDADRATKKILDIINRLEAGGASSESIGRLEDILGSLLTETTGSSDALYETAKVIRELRANTDKSDSDQLNTLNNIIGAIKDSGQFQSAIAEKQTNVIEQFVRSQSKTIVGAFPPVAPTPVPEPIVSRDQDRSAAIENIAQAAFAAGKGLEEFITDLENFYQTTKQGSLAKQLLAQPDITKPLPASATKGAALQATLATEEFGNVDFGQFLNFDELSSAIKEEIASRKASQQAIEEEKTKREKAAQEYKSSGKAFEEFGAVGAARPAQALAFKQQKLIGNFTGGDLLGKAQSFQKGPKVLQNLQTALERLPTPFGNLVRQIGGLPGVLSATASAIGSNLLPQLGSLLGVSSDPRFAAFAGGLAEGGSMAASLGTLGQQLGGPIGAMIGTIGGAVSGAISGAAKAFRTQTLENSLKNLNKNSLEASRALEKLSKIDTAENADAASKAVGKLQTNITDLGQQSRRTTGEAAIDVGAGAVSGATYAGIGVAGLAAATAAIPAITAAVPAIAGIGAALAPITGGVSLAAAAGIIAVGAAIGGITAALSGPDELDKEALQAQLKSIEEYVAGIDQLGQRRLKTKSFEEVDKFITDLDNAKTPQQRAAVGARTVRVEEAQRAALQQTDVGRQIKDSQSVEEFLNGLSGSARTAAEATAKAAQEQYLYALGMDELNKRFKGNDEAIRRESKNRANVIKLGQERNLQLGREEAQQRKVALAIKQVEQRLQGLLDVFKNINAGIKRFSEESEQYINDVDANVSNLLGTGQLRNVNRENERILANPMAYSEAEVRRAGAAAGGLAGGPEGAGIGNLALASKLIEERLPALLRGTEQGNINPALQEIKKYFEQAGVDPNSDAFREIFNQIRTSLEQAAGGGEGATLGELGIADDLVSKISKILESGREVALNIQKEYNDTLQRTIDLQNKANALLLKANEYRRKADQIRLNSEIQLSEKLGETLTLDQLNAPIATNIGSLTQGLIPGGSQDPAQIAQAIIDSQARIAQREEALTRSRNMVGLVGGADTQAGRDLIARNDAEQKAIAEEIRNTQEANQALEALANSGDEAANALKVFDQMQAKVGAATNFLTKLFTADTAELDQILVQQAAANKVLSGTATQQDFQSTAFRQQAFAGIQSLEGMMSPADFRRAMVQAQRQAMEAIAPGRLQQASGIKDAEGNNLTWDQLLKRAENPEDSPELKAYKEASAKQAEAANMMARVNEAAAQQYMSASDKIVSFFQNEFKNIVRDAFAEVRGIEASAKEATAEKPAQTAQVSATEKALKEAEQRAARSQAAAEKATEKRKTAESKWWERGGGAQEKVAEKNAMAQAKADKEEVARLQKQAEAERQAAADKAAAAQAQAKAEKEAQLAAQQQADMAAPPPSARLGVTENTAQTQNVASQNLDNASTALNESSNNLNNAVAMITSGGTAATPADIPATRATVAAATTVQNREEIQQQLFVMLDDSTKTFLTEFNTSLSSTFTTFGNNFDKYISRLEQIKLPEKIEMVGRHTVDVRVTGAAGFESLQEGMKNMIAQAIKEKMAMIWNQSDGAYGERPA